MARANSIPDRLLDEARWLATTRQFGDGLGRCRDAVVYRVREHRKKKGIPEAILGIPSSRDETRQEAPRAGSSCRDHLAMGSIVTQKSAIRGHTG